LPEASLEPLANGEAIKGNRVSTLTTDIQRVIASPDQAKALENFTGLNATKYDAKANFKEQFSQKTVLGNDIISLMGISKNFHA
jgi:ribosome-binding factor A